VFDHIGLQVSDLARSVRFYQAALRPLGLELCSQDAGGAGFGPPGAPALWLTPVAAKGPARPAHLAFRAADQEAVKRFHRAALEAGGADHGPAGPRPAYGPTYFAAFVLDPDGNNLEAVHLPA
jgi:catechol 2,3-dioxygenase-like lactoylglutathione lyase family enzyme